MKHLLSSAFALAAVVAAIAYPAQAARVSTFTIQNETGITMTTLYLSSVNDEKWGKNILKGDKLEDAAKAPIAIDDAYYKDDCKFDIRLWDANHRPYTFHNVDLCKHSAIMVYLKNGKGYWHHTD